MKWKSKQSKSNMCCFIVPLVQAIATTACRKAIKEPRTVLGRHLSDLEKMLWGGSLMLIVDHVINGELTWRFPFFTALDSVGGSAVLLREMLTVGVPMALVLTGAWVLYAYIKEGRLVRKTV